MRIERADHALERSLDELLVGNLPAVHVVLPDGLQHAGEQLNVLVGIFLGSGLGVREVKPRAKEEVQAKHGHEQSEKEAAFHNSVGRR